VEGNMAVNVIPEFVVTVTSRTRVWLRSSAFYFDDLGTGLGL
jgi:hypothetical protein